MYSAKVTFSRSGDVVEMALSVTGKPVAQSASQESIARELQIRGARYLSVDGVFTTARSAAPARAPNRPPRLRRCRNKTESPMQKNKRQ
jgi:hypothetical protein